MSQVPERDWISRWYARIDALNQPSEAFVERASPDAKCPLLLSEGDDWAALSSIGPKALGETLAEEIKKLRAAQEEVRRIGRLLSSEERSRDHMLGLERAADGRHYQRINGANRPSVVPLGGWDLEECILQLNRSIRFKKEELEEIHQSQDLLMATIKKLAKQILEASLIEIKSA